jgi:hypothetical protein
MIVRAARTAPGILGHPRTHGEYLDLLHFADSLLP